MGTLARHRITHAVTVVILLLAGVFGIAPSAHAATASLLVSISPNATPVTSGTDMVWTISWSCSASGAACTNAKIVVPVPPSNPAGVPFVVKSVSKDSNATYVATATYTSTQATWTFKNPLPAGATGQVSMVYGSTNFLTPDGTTVTPVATMSADNATSVTSNTDATITVTSTAGIYVKKERYPTTAPEPYPGDEVTYRIQVNNAYPLSAPNGTAALQGVVITDTLPPTATVQRARLLDNEPVDSDGQRPAVQCTVNGSTGPASTAGGTVVCPAWNDDLKAAAVNHRGVTVFVTVTYPTTQLALDKLTDPADDVTNTAQAVAHPIGHPEIDVTGSSSVTHGFMPRTNGGPGIGIQKTNNSQGIVSVGDSYVIWTTQIYNTGTEKDTVRFTDRFPCTYTSPTSGAAPCSPMGNTAQSIAVVYGSRTDPITVTATLTDGSVVTHTWTFPSDFATRTWTPSLPITDVKWESSLLPGETVNITYYTTVPSSVQVPAPNPASITYQRAVATTGKTWLENCVSDVSYTRPDGTVVPLTPSASLRCSFKELVVAHPVCTTNCVKHIINGTQAPGGDITVELWMQNTGTAPMYPQILDLLPPQLDYVPGSLVFGTAGGPPNFPTPADTIVEAIPNYAGTGRTLVRLTWPPNQILGPDLPTSHVGVFALTFKARVQGGYPAGGYSNTVVFGDSHDQPGLCATSTAQVDTLDLDGDGKTTDIQCKSTAPFTIAPLGGAQIIKKVKGQDDAEFQAPPAVGHTRPSGAAQWQITLRNSGSTDLDQVIAYEILPYVGDTAVGPTTEARGSQWQTLLTGVTAPADVTVQYSLSTNPCRGEVMAQGAAMTSGPATCVNDWTATAPADLTTVRALRLVSTDTTFGAGETKVVTLDVRAPADATGITWNTASIAGHTALSGWLQPAAAPKVGLVVPIDLELTKAVLSADPHVVGGHVRYRVTLTNQGPGRATGVDVTDQLPAGLTLVSATPSQGTYAAATGLWTVGTLDAGASATLDFDATITSTAVSGLINFAQVSHADQIDIDSTPGNGVVSTPHEDDEAQVPLTLVPAQPSVSIVKSTNGHDANGATGPLIEVNSSILWTYVVTNTGNLPLVDVTVTDDKGVSVTCPGTTLAANDGVAGGPDEMTCTGSGGAVAGQYANIGTVTSTATDGDGNRVTPTGSVTASDPSHYFGSDPSISIVKKINGDDAATAPGVALTPAGTMAVTFEVSNTGNVPLTAITVVDDIFGVVTCPGTTLAANDGAAGGLDEMTCTVTADAPAPGATHHNIASVSGQPPTPANGTVPRPVTDEDDAYAFTPGEASVSIVKSIEGDDANEAPGVSVPAGTPAAVTFLVTNTGTVPLKDLVVTDSVLAATDITCPQTTLVPQASMTCTAELSGLGAGETHHNVAKVVGTPVTTGGATPLGADGKPLGPVDDSDGAYAYAPATASVRIVKRINQDDANTAPGVLVDADAPMAVAMEVKNTGTVTLTDLVVIDSVLAAEDIACPETSLEPGATMICTAQVPGIVAGGSHVDTATVTGTPTTASGAVPLDKDGQPLSPVTASDIAHAYAAPAPPALPTTGTEAGTLGLVGVGLLGLGSLLLLVRRRRTS